jgi:hypothetical protein
LLRRFAFICDSLAVSYAAAGLSLDLEMYEFRLTGRGRTETFRLGNDYGPGDVRQHWTLAGLEKLIRLGLWKREFDRSGKVKIKPPTVEMMMKLSQSQRLMSA